MNEEQFLAEFYERVILPRYDEFQNAKIHWIDHGKIDLDTTAHYFSCGSKQYVLLNEDFPSGTPFEDGLSHEIIKCGNETSIELRFSDKPAHIPSITGWFTLFKEK